MAYVSPNSDDPRIPLGFASTDLNSISSNPVVQNYTDPANDPASNPNLGMSNTPNTPNTPTADPLPANPNPTGPGLSGILSSIPVLTAPTSAQAPSQTSGFASYQPIINSLMNQGSGLNDILQSAANRMGGLADQYGNLQLAPANVNPVNGNDAGVAGLLGVLAALGGARGQYVNQGTNNYLGMRQRLAAQDMQQRMASYTMQANQLAKQQALAQQQATLANTGLYHNDTNLTRAMNYQDLAGSRDSRAQQANNNTQVNVDKANANNQTKGVIAGASDQTKLDTTGQQIDARQGMQDKALGVKQSEGALSRTAAQARASTIANGLMNRTTASNDAAMERLKYAQDQYNNRFDANNGLRTAIAQARLHTTKSQGLRSAASAIDKDVANLTAKLPGLTTEQQAPIIAQVNELKAQSNTARQAADSEDAAARQVLGDASDAADQSASPTPGQIQSLAGQMAQAGTVTGLGAMEPLPPGALPPAPGSQVQVPNPATGTIPVAPMQGPIYRPRGKSKVPPKKGK